MSAQTTPPSILATAESLIDEVAVDGLAAAVTVKDGALGAEVSGKRDIGKPGGWSLGAVARWRTAKGADGAAVLRWTPKD